MTLPELWQEKILQLTYEKQQLEQFRQLNELLSRGLAAILSSEQQETLFSKLFDVVTHVIDYDAILILQLNDQQTTAQLLACLPATLPAADLTIDASCPLFRQDLNLFDLSLLDWWQQLLPLTAGYKSALTYPLHTPQSAYTMILLSRRIGAFSANSAVILRSFSTFIASTLSQLEKRKLQDERDTLRAQQHRIEQSLLRQEKMAAIGQLAAGVAHELNNPLGFIYCNLNTLKHYLQQYDSFIQSSVAAHPELIPQAKALQLDYIRSESKDLLEESLEGARRARDIINNLRTFSHPDEKTMQEIDFGTLLKDTARIAQTQVKHNAKIQLDLPDSPAMVCGNSTQLSQVLLNLLMNANQAITNGKGEIRLILRETSGLWQLQITDNGCGIAEHVAAHIFEPFFTTKPVGQGTGLGLSMSRAIAEQHGGSLMLASSGSTGSSFVLTLPALEQC